MAETKVQDRRSRQTSRNAGNLFAHRRSSALHAVRPGRLELRQRSRLSRQFPYTRGVQATHVPRPPLDHAAVRRHGRRRRVESPLQVSAEPGNDRTEHRLRSADADRARFRQPARDGRSRQGGRGHRFHRGHDALVRRHQPGKGLHVDDDQRDRRDPAGAVHRYRAA